MKSFLKRFPEELKRFVCALRGHRIYEVYPKLKRCACGDRIILVHSASSDDDEFAKAMRHETKRRIQEAMTDNSNRYRNFPW